MAVSPRGGFISVVVSPSAVSARGGFISVVVSPSAVSARGGFAVSGFTHWRFQVADHQLPNKAIGGRLPKKVETFF